MNFAAAAPIIGAGIELVTSIGGIIGRAIAGAYQSPEEIRAAFLSATDKFASFVAVGGEMDQRRDAARKKTDDAIERAEHSAPNPTKLVDADALSSTDEPTKS